MSFNLQKYLIENNLTLISSKRISEDVDDDTEEPSKDDVKDANKGVQSMEKEKRELEALKAKAKSIIFKYTVDTPQGRKVKGSITDYKKAIGTIPDKIKQLEKKIKDAEGSSEDEENQD